MYCLLALYCLLTQCAACARLFVLLPGETEETAAERAREVVAACQEVHSSVSRLFEGIEMPASSVWLWPRS
jgi:hypothetical protein